MKNFTILIVALLVSACGTVPATMKIVGEDIFRGSASGSIGSNATIEMQNINGVICNGYIYIPVIDPTTKGSIKCSDGREGIFIANGSGDSWSGDGKFSNGTKFFLLIGPQSTSVTYK